MQSLQLMTLVAILTVGRGLESLVSTPPPLPADFRGRVAFACRHSGAGGMRPAMVWSAEGAWRREPSQTGCLTDPDEIRDFCRRVYPGLTVANVEPAVELESFPSWCPEGPGARPRHCPILNVRPYECISAGPYQSPSLLVSRGCQFMHNSSETPDAPGSCHRADYWKAVADRACGAVDKGGRAVARFGLLLPCNFMPSAGYFAGVEFVCCPKIRIETAPVEVDKPPRKSSRQLLPQPEPPAAAAVAAATPVLNKSPSDVEDDATADADDARYQRYLALATESGHSEHARFSDARLGLRHHQARREGAMVTELREAEARILRLSPRDPESARRLLDEVEKQFRRSFMSVQREEVAEHDQLDAVHQQRIGLLFVGKLRHIKRLLAQSVAEGNAKAAGRYFARLAGLIAREVVRLANRAGRLSGHLAPSHLAILRQHAAELLADLKDSGADAGLRRLAGLASISEILSQHEAVLKKASAELADAVAAAPDSAAAAYPPKLAERFDNLLRLYHQQSLRVLGRQGSQLPPKQQPAVMKPSAASHTAHAQHHSLKMFHQDTEGATSSSSNGIQQEPYVDLTSALAKPQMKTSSVLIGLFSGLALILTIVVVLVALRLCHIVHTADHPTGKGYKLSLVDEDLSSSDTGGSSSVSGVGAPYEYPTVKPEKASLGDPHLASMQMNGYENPTYRFYEK